MPNTVVETESGKTAPASKVKGLSFVEAVQPQTSLPAAPPITTNQATPQSIPAPVAEGGKSSLLVTLIGIVAVLIVGGIGWAMITSSSPVKQVPITEAKQEQEQEKQKQILVEQKEQKQFTAAEQSEIDKFLNVHGTDVKKRVGEDGGTLLHLAAEDKDASLALVKYLISQGADVHAKSYGGSTPLHWAAYSGNVESARLLVSKGADVNAKNLRDVTALLFAAEEEHLAVAQFLVSEGADVNAKDNIERLTALNRVASKGNVEFAQLLVSAGANVFEPNNRGDTPLVLAQREGHAAMVEYLADIYVEIADKQEQEVKENIRKRIDFVQRGTSAVAKVRLSAVEKDAIIQFFLLVGRTTPTEDEIEWLLYDLEKYTERGEYTPNWAKVGKDSRLIFQRVLVNKIDPYIVCLAYFDSRQGRGWRNDPLLSQIENQSLQYQNESRLRDTLLALLPVCNRLSGNAHNAIEKKRLESDARSKNRSEERSKVFGN